MISVKNGFLTITTDQEEKEIKKKNRRTSLRSLDESYVSTETYSVAKPQNSIMYSDMSTMVPCSLVGRRLSDTHEDQLFEFLPKNLEHLLIKRCLTNSEIATDGEGLAKMKEVVSRDGISSFHDRLSSTPSLEEGDPCQNFVTECSRSLFGDFIEDPRMDCFQNLKENGGGNWCDEESEGEAIYPSKGSKLHNSGDCRPCAFLHKPRGCTEGYECEFCHSCDKNDYVSRKKLRAKKGKEIKRQAKMSQDFDDEDYF